MILFKKHPLSSWEFMIYGFLSMVVIFFLTKGGVYLSPDSINYLSIAKIINTGKFSQSFVSTWPPLFPMLIAFVNSLGFEAEESARIISIALYSVLAVVMFLLAKATSGRLVAHLTSISMLFCAPLLFVYSSAWSETLYITLSAISLLMLYKFYETDDPRSKRYLIWSALFVALGLLTRYIGVALFLTGFLIILFKKESRTPVRKIKSQFLFSIIAWTPLILYLTGCKVFKGLLPSYGHARIASLWQNLGSFFDTVYHDLLSFELRFPNLNIYPYTISWQPNIPLPLLAKFTGSIFLLIINIFFFLRLFKKDFENQVVCLTYLACYSLSLLGILTIWVPLNLETRFCTPIYPYIMLVGFFIIVAVCKDAIRRKSKWVFLIGATIALASFWFIQFGSTVNVYMRMPHAETSVVARGDITGDEVFDVSDLLFLTNYLYRNGPQPRPLQNANVNCDEAINLADAIYLINYIYKGGPPPCHFMTR